MSVTYATEPHPVRHPLAPGATPSAIRAGLLTEDRAGFDAAYTAALAAARVSLELSAVFTTLEQWRWVAALQSDRADFARVRRRAAALRTGEPVSENASCAGTRVTAGLAAGRGYRLDTDEAGQAQLAALPPDGQLSWQDLRARLELSPQTERRAVWQVACGVRIGVFGECGQGLVYYLVLPEWHRVEVLAVRWCA